MTIFKKIAKKYNMSKITDFGWQQATNAADSAIGTIMGMVTGKIQDKRQLEQQKKLNALQIEGNKEMEIIS